MKTILTHTGKIYVDTEHKLEFLTVGDYGKENNIKANFLGLTKEINGVANTEVDLSKKWVATISTQKGCPMKCKFCDVPKFGFYGNVSIEEMEWQIRNIIKNDFYGGEAGLQFSINSTNDEQRRELFDNKSHSLATISEMASRLPMPKGRKYTLNFPVTAQTILDAKELSRLFDKEKFIVKITPIHETASAVENGFEVTGYSDYNVYRQFEQPLLEEGWDVIVFVPSKEEDSDRITCGNALISEEKI